MSSEHGPAGRHSAPLSFFAFLRGIAAESHYSAGLPSLCGFRPKKKRRRCGAAAYQKSFLPAVQGLSPFIEESNRMIPDSKRGMPLLGFLRTVFPLHPSGSSLLRNTRRRRRGCAPTHSYQESGSTCASPSVIKSMVPVSLLSSCFITSRRYFRRCG